MLERETIAKHVPPTDSWQDSLMEVDHVSLLKCVRQSNSQVIQEILGGSDIPQALILEGVPIPVRPHRFCELMEPFLCMN